MKIKEFVHIMNYFIPNHYSYSWDNTGLLIGNDENRIKKVLLALDVTDEVIDEAIKLGCNLIVSHHPLIFNPLKTINTNDPVGKKIYKLIFNDIGVYTAHTNLDIIKDGVNDTLANLLGLINIRPIEAVNHTSSPYVGVNSGERIKNMVQQLATVDKYLVDSSVGSINDKDEEELPYIGMGRIGLLEEKVTLRQFMYLVKDRLNIEYLNFIGDENKVIEEVALCGGTGMSLFDKVKELNPDVYLTSDIKFHEAQAAKDADIALIDANHFSTENIIINVLYNLLNNLSETKDFEIECSSYNGRLFKSM